MKNKADECTVKTKVNERNLLINTIIFYLNCVMLFNWKNIFKCEFKWVDVMIIKQLIQIEITKLKLAYKRWVSGFFLKILKFWSQIVKK
jgi:hypothetical protein